MLIELENLDNDYQKKIVNHKLKNSLRQNFRKRIGLKKITKFIIFSIKLI